MSRATCVLLFLASLCVPTAVSQTPQTETTAPARENCGCESQVLPDTLAIVNGVKITSSEIKKSTGDSVSQLEQQVIDARKRELDLMINSKLLELEAKTRGITTVKLLEQEVLANVKRPTQTEAQAFYDQNKARIKDQFKDVVDDIVTYLFEQRQREAAKKFADTLRSASEVKVLVTDVTAPATEADRARVLATIKGESITSGDVEDSLLPLISDIQEQVYKLRKDELDLTVNDTLLAQEADKRKITVNAVLEAEVKPKPVTEEQIRQFYDQNKERVSGDLTQSKDAIKQYLEQVELRLAQRAFVEKLRAAATIQIFLVKPPAKAAAPKSTAPSESIKL